MYVTYEIPSVFYGAAVGIIPLLLLYSFLYSSDQSSFCPTPKRSLCFVFLYFCIFLVCLFPAYDIIVPFVCAYPWVTTINADWYQRTNSSKRIVRALGTSRRLGRESAHTAADWFVYSQGEISKIFGRKRWVTNGVTWLVVDGWCISSKGVQQQRKTLAGLNGFARGPCPCRRQRETFARAE